MISIIIVVKNDRKIELLLNRIYHYIKKYSVEILVIDASEGNLNVIKNKFILVKWITFKNNKNKKYSVPDQRNLGLKHASGDIIVFTDSDCLPIENWLEELTNPLLKNKEAIVAGKILSTRKYPKIWNIMYHRIENSKYIGSAATGNVAIQSKVFRKIGEFNTIFEYGNDDTDFFWRAIHSGYKIKYNKNAIVYHDYGNLVKNVHRLYNYGKLNYQICKIYPKKVFTSDKMYLVAYPVYIILLPIIIIHPLLLLLLLIPFIKNLYELHSVENSIETIIFNILSSIGFIKEFMVNILEYK